MFLITRHTSETIFNILFPVFHILNFVKFAISCMPVHSRPQLSAELCAQVHITMSQPPDTNPDAFIFHIPFI